MSKEMTKNDRCLNSLIKKVRKLKENSDSVIVEYEKNLYVKPILVIYGIINGIDSLYNALIIAMEKEKNDTTEKTSSEKTDN